MAGYSGTPLPKKLGIKPHARVIVLRAPDAFADTLGTLDEGVTLSSRLSAPPADVIVLFCKDLATLRANLGRARKGLAQHGGLWIAWPKKASGVATDLTENDVRELGLAGGLVDNKVCAIDETWSGLRLVIPLAKRTTPKTKPAVTRRSKP